ncbi:MAG: hypothetical protein HY543_11490 [Deltaproteobacteria bacterium]|nr:hypothetical protein [Deltaproteobacteria bacterium]
MKLLLLLLLLGSVSAQAESLSDLNMQQFQEKKEAQTVAPARSPFMPQRVGKEELLVQDLRLTGVAYSEAESYALVSGTLVQVGDRLGGYRVTVIERTRVVLRKLDETVILKLEGAL